MDSIAQPNNKNLGIVAFPSSGPNNTLCQLIELLAPLSNKIHVITGNEISNYLKNPGVSSHCLDHNRGKNVFSKVFNYFLSHMKMSLYFFQVARKYDVWIFLRSETLLLPIIISYLLGKKPLLILGGSAEEYKLNTNLNKIDALILTIFRKISFQFASIMVVYSPILIKKWDLSSYEKKILVAHRHFIRINDNINHQNLSEREKIIGYIGRLSKEKGVMNFVKAIPDVLKSCDVKFIICGDGPLLDEIKDYIRRHNLENDVLLSGWISHDEINKYLEKLKLLVLPSYTEGLPNIVLESMACGTPVLATPVGAIPDLIDEGKTGFIMNNNSHECIVKNITRVLQYKSTEMITQNAFNLIKSKYSYESTVGNWQKVLGEIYG